MDAAALTADEATELTGALVRIGWARPGELPRFTPLAGGVSSLIVRADLGGRSVCVKRALPKLKVASDWSAPIERSDAEAAWLRTAAAIVPGSVPRPIGQDRVTRAFAMDFLDPADYPVWKSQLLAGQADASTARAVASALVAIHAATAGRPEVAAAFPNHLNFAALRLEPYFAAAALAHPAQARVLGALIRRTDSTRLALIHGDVSPKNILVGPHGPILVDAECATYGDPAFDVAFCLNHLLLKCVWRPQTKAAYLACYEAFSDVYFAGVQWEPRATIEQRASTLLPALLLARVDGKSPVEYLVDEARRELVRRFAIEGLDRPGDSIAALRDNWNRHIQ
ncbi:MAG: phosphotransferase family protein [Burkholderiaceae bacterium]